MSDLTTPPTRRRWYQFGLAMFVVIGVAIVLRMTPDRVGLYADCAIKAAIAEHAVKDPDGFSSEGAIYVVVPIGDSIPRRQVFDSLRLDETRLNALPLDGVSSVVFLRWQVSPNYEIECMTATNDEDNNGLDFRDSRRKIYGVQFKRIADTKGPKSHSRSTH